MAKFPPQYRAAAEAAEKELPSLRKRRDALVKQIEALDQEIMFTENIISLWGKMSGEGIPVPPEIEMSLPSTDETQLTAEASVPKMMADILRDGRTVSAKDLRSAVSQRRSKPVPLATIYSALARNVNMFQKSGKGYRLKPQRDAGIKQNAPSA